MTHEFPAIQPEDDENEAWEESLDDLTCSLQLEEERLLDAELQQVVHLTAPHNRPMLIQAAWRVLIANGANERIAELAENAVHFPDPYPCAEPAKYLRIHFPDRLAELTSVLTTRESPDLRFELLQQNGNPEFSDYRGELIQLLENVSVTNADTIWNLLYQYGTAEDVANLQQKDRDAEGDSVFARIAASLSDKLAKTS